MSLYHTCIEKIDKVDKLHFLPEANELMKNFIKKNPKYYLDNFIREWQIPSNLKIADPFVTEIFGSHKEFEDFLYNCNNYDDIQTIKKFFTKFKKNNYEPISWGNEVREFK